MKELLAKLEHQIGRLEFACLPGSRIEPALLEFVNTLKAFMAVVREETNGRRD